MGGGEPAGVLRNFAHSRWCATGLAREEERLCLDGSLEEVRGRSRSLDLVPSLATPTYPASALKRERGAAIFGVANVGRDRRR
jgi:hypothetical protein